MEDFGEIGVAALVALLLLRETFSFLKHKNGNGNGNGNGATKHYVYESSKAIGSLEAELRKLNQGVSGLNQLISTLTHHVVETRGEVKQVRDELKRK